MEKFSESEVTAQKIDNEILRKTCLKSSDRKHDWVLGRLRSHDSIWVCKFCGAIRVLEIKYAV